MVMDSSFNYRHAQIHRADLSQRAELHRLAAQARRTRRDQRPAGSSLLARPSLEERAHALIARLRHQSAATTGRAS
jgi:hypothetical protein